LVLKDIVAIQQNIASAHSTDLLNVMEAYVGVSKKTRQAEMSKCSKHNLFFFFFSFLPPPILSSTWPVRVFSVAGLVCMWFENLDSRSMESCLTSPCLCQALRNNSQPNYFLTN
jgi:hypothetical protein